MKLEFMQKHENHKYKSFCHTELYSFMITTSTVDGDVEKTIETSVNYVPEFDDFATVNPRLLTAEVKALIRAFTFREEQYIIIDN
jgi:hypothetical protein|tara:strand:- start:775 stop:1029 length:255 start_codon:yes stop_codon:yes gene_type:complete